MFMGSRHEVRILGTSWKWFLKMLLTLDNITHNALKKYLLLLNFSYVTLQLLIPMYFIRFYETDQHKVVQNCKLEGKWQVVLNSFDQ